MFQIDTRLFELEMKILRMRRMIDAMESRLREVEIVAEITDDDVKEPLFVQSQDTKTASEEVETSEHEVMEFADGTEGTQAGQAGVVDPTMRSITTSYGLAKFLERPVNIATYVIPQGEGYVLRYLAPWRSFFDSPSIIKKLDNFAYIRCNLHVKYVINSSPFIYGAYGVGYQPLPKHQTTLRPIGADATEKVMVSQRQNFVLESHKNKGGEMVLPFFYHKDWLQTKLIDFEDMGQLVMWPYANFASANGTATGSVSVKVYAWAENVELAGPTGLVVQSQDEYGNGPVSSVATSIASFSQHLEHVPIIGKFARATTIGASAVSSIARLFGWTNVPVIEDVKPLKNQPFHAFASSEISTPIEKLTLDPKNELTVDPSVTGIGSEDELSIAYLCGKESFLIDSDWTQAMITDTSLLVMNVTPTMCRLFANPIHASSNVIYDTPMGHVSQMFDNWRGSLIVRIKVVASRYHQGRLRVTYDPKYDIFTDPDTESVSLTKIIDLSVTDEAEFTIPYMQETAFLRVRDTPKQDVGITSTDLYDPDFCNGRFQIRVLTDLTGPDTTSSVKILAFVRAGPDFEVANPGILPSYTTPLRIQSGDELAADGKVEYTMGELTSRADHLNEVYFGEAIRSVRTLMRRTCFYMTNGCGLTRVLGEDDVIRIGYNLYPTVPGFRTQGPFRANGLVTTGSTYDMSPCVNTPFTWMAYCFTGVRGSMHYHFNSVNRDMFQSVTTTRFMQPVEYRSILTSTGFAKFTGAQIDNGSCASGMALQNERTQTGVSCSVPYMNKFKFVPTDPELLGNGSTVFDMANNNLMVQYHGLPDTAYVGEFVHDVYSAIGTDLQLLYFVGVPPVYTYRVSTITGYGTGDV